MTRLLLVILALSVSGSQAAARCYRYRYANGYTLNSYNWPKHGGCFSCHKAKSAAAYDWRQDMTRIAGRIADNADFETNLDKLLAARARPAGAYAQGGGYSTLQGEFSSYPVQGQTLFGASAYGVSPAIDRMAILNMQTKLQASVQAAAHQGAQDTVDLLNVSHAQATEESKLGLLLQANQAAFMAAQPQPVQQTFRFSATTQPNGQVVIQPEAVQQPANPGLAVLENRCASCHDGPAAPGKFSLAGELTKDLAVEIERRVNLPVDDPQSMPRVKTADGFAAGLPLTPRERHDLETLLWSVQ